MAQRGLRRDEISDDLPSIESRSVSQIQGQSGKLVVCCICCEVKVEKLSKLEILSHRSVEFVVCT